MSDKTLIIGMGEIGKSLKEVLTDYYPIITEDLNNCNAKCGIDFMHICFPYSDNFVYEVLSYKKKYNPKYTIIHSTVPIGVSRSCGAVNAPCIGIHPHLKESMTTFTKFLGGKDAGNVAQYFRRAGIKVNIFPKQETTELAKIASTTFYATMIEFIKELNRECTERDLSFSEVYTLWTDNYNKGYEKLGYPEYTRPLLIPIMGTQGGHCTIPNCDLWENEFTKLIKRLNGKDKKI